MCVLTISKRKFYAPPAIMVSGRVEGRKEVRAGGKPVGGVM